MHIAKPAILGPRTYGAGMTPAARAATRRIALGDAQAPRAPRCAHTLLTKPECHCPVCLSEQIDAHRGANALSTDLAEPEHILDD